MNIITQVLRKPYDFVAGRFHRKSETQKLVWPSECRRANVFHAILSPIETYIVSFQSLLIWERPIVSATAFITINIVYWLIVSWNRRFYSILSIFGLCFFGYKTWIFQIWPEIRVPPEEGDDTESWIALTPGVLSVPEVSRYLNDFCEKMLILFKDVWKLRKENHGLFCALMCAFFSILAFIGKVIPGVLLIYTLVLMLSLGPGVVMHLLPSTLYDQFVGFFAESDSQASEVSKCGGNSDRDSDIEEFVPETSAEVLRQLSLRDEVPEVPSPGIVLTESGEPENGFSVENSINEADELSLYQGLGAFPSVEEEGESDLDDAISESDIIPDLEAENSDLHFLPTHFKEESSESDSETVFTEGLSFAKTALIDIKQEPSENKETKETASKRKRSSSSDLDDDLADFEILEESDILS